MTRPLVLTIAALAGMSLPAHAFDCAKASTETEKLICSDSDLKAIDDKLGEHWAAIKDGFSKQAWQAMLTSQREWLKQRDATCSAGTGQERVDCLKAETRNRIDAFGMAHRSGSGLKGALEPFGIESDGGLRGYKVEFTGFRFTDPVQPGETAWNAIAQKLMDEAPVEDKVDFDPPGGSLDFSQSMELTYASPELMSVTVHTGRYDGGAHPNSYSASYNVHMQDGVLKFADVFRPDAVARLSKMCFERLARLDGEKLTAQQRRESLFEPKPEALHDMVANLAAWAYNEAGAKVLFPPYAIGPYAAGEFECQLPLKTLKALAVQPRYLPD
jgi:uncharacterized protein